jgi:nucleotide-binding universal stress UspA family protein
MMEKILIATDGSRHSEEAAKKGLQIAGLYGSAITALYVIDIGKEYASLGDLTTKMADDIIQSMRSGLAAKGREALDRVEQMAKESGRTIEKRVVEGYPADDIIRVADEEKAKLIVLGRIGATGIERFLLGSVADKVVRNSKVPVLVVSK